MSITLVTVMTKGTARGSQEAAFNILSTVGKAHIRMRGILQRVAPNLPELLNQSVWAKASGILEK